MLHAFTSGLTAAFISVAANGRISSHAFYTELFYLHVNQHIKISVTKINISTVLETVLLDDSLHRRLKTITSVLSLYTKVSIYNTATLRSACKSFCQIHVSLFTSFHIYVRHAQSQNRVKRKIYHLHVHTKLQFDLEFYFSKDTYFCNCKYVCLFMA